ncbi:MAG: NADH-quinone oxidoreductase subunit N [Dehalococcoidia bacterium]|jgi:NADH-quinone oxidoreductase subunit N|nr:NADH-quinone oxidoreductase subunit N [Dehalococcoidia bacterium]
MMNYLLFSPEFILTAVAFGVLGIDLFVSQDKKVYLPALSLVGLVGVFVLSLCYLWDKDTTLYDGLFLVDNFSLFFKAFFLVLGVLVVLASVDYVKKHLSRPGEYYGILLFSILGMMLMASSGELLTAYIALELLSFSLYVLVSYGRNGLKPSEAGVKYILLGAFASALLLYGISQVYGMLGTTHFAEIHAALLVDGTPLNSAVLVGLVLIIAGLGFKIAAVPFHMWAPDVYEGAPTPVTAYLAVGSKAAAFALMLRLFSQAFMPVFDDWQIILVILAALTMTVGNLVALAQQNIKRMLAYSSVGQVGYLLMGMAALSPLAANGVIFHLVGYGVTNLAAFMCVIIFYNATSKEEISDFAGLADRSPFVAMVLSVSLFSLAGLPFFAGFTTKFYLFAAAADGGLLWLVGLAIANSLISLYYYMMVMKQMYMVTADDSSHLSVSMFSRGVLGMLLVGIIVIGIYPGPLVNVIEVATGAILP